MTDWFKEQHGTKPQAGYDITTSTEVVFERKKIVPIKEAGEIVGYESDTRKMSYDEFRNTAIAESAKQTDVDSINTALADVYDLLDTIAAGGTI